MKHRLLRFWLLALTLILSGSPAPARPVPPETYAEILISGTLRSVRRIKDQRQRAESLEQMSTALARLGRLNDALAVAYNADVRDDVLRLSARREATAGRIWEAMSAASRIKGSLSRIDALFAIARAHLRYKRLWLARNTLYQAAPLARASKSVDVLAYHAWLLSRTGDRTGAMRLFAAARQVPRDRETALRDHRLQVIAYYQAKAGFYEEALATAGHERWALFPVIKRLCAKGEFERATQAVAQFTSKEDQVGQLGEIAFREARAGQRGDALVTGRQMQDILDELQQSSQLDPERTLWEKISIAMIHAIAGDLEKAHRLFALSKASSNIKPWHEVSFRFFMAMEPEVRAQMDKAAQEQAMQDALDAISRLEKTDEAVSLLLMIVKKQQELGQIEAMRQTLQRAAATAQAALNANPNVDAGDLSLQVARQQYDTGDAAAAEQAVLLVMQAPYKKPNQQGVALSLARNGFFDEALAHLTKLPPLDSDSYATLAQMQTARQRTLAALQWIEKLPDARHRAAALNGLTIGLLPDIREERELVLSGGMHKRSISSSRFDDD